jgi:hypothetical protein
VRYNITPQLLVDSFYSLQKNAAAGVDGVTWREYEKILSQRVDELHRMVQVGAFRATPSRRVYTPKADGRQRPLGIASIEDKIVQQAVVTVLSAIYEEDFLGFSYGLRPGRGQHDALDALAVGIKSRKVICDRRYQVRFTLLTSQLRVNKRHAQIGDPTVADSNLDRLVHNAYQLDLSRGRCATSVAGGTEGRSKFAFPPRGFTGLSNARGLKNRSLALHSLPGSTTDLLTRCR